MYNAHRFAGKDTACFLIHDEYCVTDTFFIPITVRQDTIDIPFFDDFSYSGPYPRVDYWLNTGVFINSTFSDVAPSVGMASFDGLNEEGSLRGGGYGISDQLTSAYLDMTKVNAPNNAYLSFWVQPKGLLFKPLSKDSFIVEFKKQDGSWQQIDSYGYPGDTIGERPFEYQVYEITSEYLYKGFQFRFSNYSDNNAAMRPWNLDYVQVREQPVAPAENNRDLAFTRKPYGLLDVYSAMPWNHFVNDPGNFIVSEFPADVLNHFNMPNSITDNHIDIYEANDSHDFPG